LHISILELIIKGIPEGFLDVLCIYVFTRTSIEKKKYILQSIITVLAIYLIRQLPINYGVNSILSLLFFAILFSFIYKMPFSKIIKAGMVTIIIIFICELINVYLLYQVFGSELTQQLLSESVSKSICGIPSTVLFALIILISSYILKRIDKHRKGINGEISEKNSK